MRSFTVGGLLLLGAMPGTLRAQSAGDAQANAAADDIVVTASKAGQQLDRAPLSAVTLGSDELAALNVQSVRDAQVRLPSIVYNDSGGSAQVYIRGVGSNSAYAGLESSIGTYVDGVYLQRQVGASVEVVDLRSIEVLNGPQGSLYGRNATGGVVLVNTNDPSRKLEGRVGIEVGNLGRHGGEAVINAPLGPDLAVRVAGRYTGQDGYIRNVANGDRLGGFDNGTIRGKVKWTPGRFTAVAALEYHKEKLDPLVRRTLVDAPLCAACAVYGTTSPTGFYQVDQTRTRKTKIGYTAATLNLKYEGDDYDIVSVTGYRDFNYAIFVDQDFASGDLYNSRAEEFGETLTEDAYIRTRFSGPFNFLAGLSGELDRDSLLIEVFGDAFGPLQGAGGTTRVKLGSISPYGEAYLKLSDTLKMTVGGRYNIDTKKLRAINNGGAAIAFGASPLVRQKVTYRNFTPRLVLSRETPTSTVYAGISKGTKSGGYNSPAFTPLEALRPEKLTSYEAGVKARGLNGRIQLSATGFYYDYNDIQVSFVNSETGGISAQNAASARMYGMELSTTLRVTDALTLNAGGLIESGHFRRYPSAAIYCPAAFASPSFDGCPAPTGGVGLAGGTADLSGTRLPRAPEVSYAIGLDYRLPLSDRLEATFTANDRYSSAYDVLPGAGGPLGLSRQPGFHMVSLGLTLEDERTGLEARFYVNNLTKSRYYLDIPTSAFGVAGSAAPPRTYGVTLAYNFGEGS